MSVTESELDDQQKVLLDRLISEANKPRSATSYYRIVRDPSKWDTPDLLLDILGLSAESVGKETSEVIELSEVLGKQEQSSDWEDFKWKLTAFHELQDVFDTPIFLSKESPLNLFHLWYFYFESWHLLKESILCGFKGLHAASNNVLRLFLEFSVLQLYYYKISHETRSYERLEQYFRDRIHPSWHTAIQKAVPKDSFCRPIKVRLDLHFKGLSDSAAHSYHPMFSPRRYSNEPGHPSVEGIFFWQLTGVVLQAVLWAYYVNFPMLFFPCNAVRKFGFNGPVGLFVDEKCTTAVTRSLAGDHRAFLDYAELSENAKGLLSWLNSHPDLTEPEIVATWNTAEDGELKRIFPEGYAKQVAKLRALRKTLALSSPEWDKNDHDEADVPDIFSYEQWKKVYKRTTKK